MKPRGLTRHLRQMDLPRRGDFLFAAGYISYSTFAGVMRKGIGLSSVGVTWFCVMYGASSIAGSALGAALLSGGFARRIALSAALAHGLPGLLAAPGGAGSDLDARCGEEAVAVNGGYAA